jgi:hypothetical protein
MYFVSLSTVRVFCLTLLIVFFPFTKFHAFVKERSKLQRLIQTGWVASSYRICVAIQFYEERKGPLEVGRISLLEALSSETSGDQQVHVPTGLLACLPASLALLWRHLRLTYSQKLSCTQWQFGHLLCACHDAYVPFRVSSSSYVACCTLFRHGILHCDQCVVVGACNKNGCTSIYT